MEKSNWSLFGQRPKNPAPSWVAVVLAFFLASQTFIQVGDSYPLYMTGFAIGGSLWMIWLAFKAKALFGGLFIPIALLWLNPLVGGDPFTSFTVLMFLAHAALAILFAVAAYTFAARQRV
ncbi:MAG: hypothetical protein P8M68_00590 [Aquiluna sp.]|nr:hypothetical protein [Aquiluna sp.]